MTSVGQYLDILTKTSLKCGCDDERYRKNDIMQIEWR